MSKWDIIKIVSLLAAAGFEILDTVADWKRGEDLDDRIKRVALEDKTDREQRNG